MTVQLEVTLGGEPVRIIAPGLNSSGWAETILAVAEGCGWLLGLDVESTYMSDLAQFDPDFRVRTVQLAGTDVAYVLRLDDLEQRQSAIDVLSDERVSFTSHSNMDVLSVYTVLGIDITGRNFDTLSPARMADTDKDRDRDLKTLAEQHGMPELPAAEVSMYERFKQLWPGKRNAKKSEVEAYGFETIALDDPAFVLYAGLDALCVRRVAPVLVRATQAPAELLRVESFLSSRANRIQIRGMRVDRPLLEELYAESTTAVSAAKERFAELTAVNAQYSPGVVEWFGAHGVEWSTWAGAVTKTGAPSLAKENVGLLADYPLDDVAQRALVDLREVKQHLDMKTKTTGVRSHTDANGFVHPVLHPMGASTTARMSSAGPNFQNFSKRDPRMRGVFLPRPGSVFVTIDFDQVELRVVAALAREDKMIETILAGGDLHQLTVDELAAVGITITRDVAKIVNFLIVYGGGAKALHEQAGIPLDLAADIIRAHRDRYTSIGAYSKYLALQRVSIRTISGRRLAVTRNRKTNDLRVHANVNYAVQSAARELLVDSWYRFDREFGRGEYVWYPIHDELVLEVPEHEVEAVIADAERCMRFEFRGVPISATAVELRDEQGVSRWMTSKRAEQIRKAAA